MLHGTVGNMCNEFQQKEFLSHPTRPIYQPAPGLQMIVSTPPHDATIMIYSHK